MTVQIFFSFADFLDKIRLANKIGCILTNFFKVNKIRICQKNWAIFFCETEVRQFKYLYVIFRVLSKSDTTKLYKSVVF